MSASATNSVPHLASLDRSEVRFGPFRFSPLHHALFQEERPVRLGSRAIDILTVLVSRAGDVIGEEELIAAAWPDTFVDDTNLRVQMAALRKVLGDGRAACRYISTVAGRGYRFVAPVSVAPAVASENRPPRSVEFAELPAPVTPVFGRAEAILALGEELSRRRLVSVIGPAGIGKSTVALAAAREAAAAFGGDVRFVDLTVAVDPESAVRDAVSVPDAGSALASATGGAQFADQRLLLVLDNCEHAVDMLAPLVETLLRAMRGVSILATSREPLRADGERTHRLAPLTVPPPALLLSAQDAMRFPSVQLFVEHATASQDGFQLSDRDAPDVADICRRLDGLPLAIELAAGRVHALGVANLRAMLHERFRLLGGGRRTASPRHRTLTAALDWSYDVLPEVERAALCRLGGVPGSFDLDTAMAILGPIGNDARDATTTLAGLVSKSLVMADSDGRKRTYRLLETTRAYLREKLATGGTTTPFPQWKLDDHRPKGIDPPHHSGPAERSDFIDIRLASHEPRAN